MPGKYYLGFFGSLNGIIIVVLKLLYESNFSCGLSVSYLCRNSFFKAFENIFLRRY